MLAYRLSREGLAALALLMLLALQACIVYVDTDDDYDDDHHLYGSRWYLEVIVHHGHNYRVGGVAPFTLSFENDDFAGVADCNDYGGAYEADTDGFFDIRNLYATEVACGANSLEDAFFDVLRDADYYRLRGETLTLSDGDDVLVFRRD